MRSIELEVFQITLVDSMDWRKKIGSGEVTRGAKIEEIHLRVPHHDDEDDHFQVGNVCGRVRDEGNYKILVVDPEMMGRFKIGQRIKLA